MIALPALNEEIFLFVCVFGLFFFFCFFVFCFFCFLQCVGQSLEGRVLRNASYENIFVAKCGLER